MLRMFVAIIMVESIVEDYIITTRIVVIILEIEILIGISILERKNFFFFFDRFIFRLVDIENNVIQSVNILCLIYLSIYSLSFSFV